MKNVALEIRERARGYDEVVAMRHKVNREWVDTSYRALDEQAGAVAAALLSLGVATGERVALFAPNSPDWILSDLGVQSIRAVTVPIFATSTADQARYIVEDARTRVAFAGAGSEATKLRQVRADCGLPEIIITLDGPLDQPEGDDTDLGTFMALGRAHDDGGEAARRAELAAADDLASVIYTSGTTGEPKGVMLVHDNFRNQFTTLDSRFEVGSADRSLCFLPLSHVYERSWSYFVYLSGACNAFVSNPIMVVEYMRQIRPTAMVSAPRLYEKVYATLLDRVEKASPVRRALFRWALWVGRRYNTRRYDGGAAQVLRLEHALADKLVLAKIREIMGGPKNFLSSGGAALAREVEELFFAVGYLVCQGYGLTETAPMLTCNSPADFRFGTVGKPIDGVEISIADDGEILARGPNLMRGYFNKPEATAEVIRDGWFHTGDVGALDDDGFLAITGRIKDLIITSTGKNVAPQLIETVVGKDHYIEQLAVIGDKRNHLSALIVPAYETLAEWAQNKRLSFSDHDELVKLPEVVRFMTERIRAQSKSLAPFERIKRFTLMARQFTMEAGEITPTLKVRRKVILQKYKTVIDSMYA
jgi:long-chain acyl-CoA synthetase